ncbi:MAG: YraN family protein [Betaproteobacteria bacterium]|nr:YraN family protein [Betaproteobacteria bacterium]
MNQNVKPLNTSLPVPNTKQRGDAAELRAWRHLHDQGMTLIVRNYRTPGRGGGEIDLIVRDRDGTLVFVEVRARASDHCGGAAASISAAKRRRIVYAAKHFLRRYNSPPACRFDVVLLQAEDLIWLKAAFEE